MSSLSRTVYRGVDGAVKSNQSDLPTLGPLDVLVKITHASLCGTDLGYMPYGIALGHEGVGIVQDKGIAVTQVQIGDRVGGGYHRGSCGHCQYCLKGQDIWCYERLVFGEGDYDNGTFSEYYIGKETYIHKIPETIKDEHAAPLQCAGVTVYGGMIDVVKPFQRVGIIGIGGLGHLAIQFAAKMGAKVVVFSHSKDKEAEALSFGATEFYALDEVEKLSAPVDVLVLTGNRYPDWSKYVFLSRFSSTPNRKQIHGKECSCSYRNYYSSLGAPWKFRTTVSRATIKNKIWLTDFHLVLSRCSLMDITSILIL